MARRTREFRSDRRSGGGSNPVLAALAWLASAITTAVAVGLVMALLVVVDAHRPGPTDKRQVVVIPRGAGAVQIARHLEAERVIRNAIAFRAASMLYAPKRSLKAGEYAIPAGASMRMVLDQIVSGRVMLHAITIPEGFTSQMAVDVINAADELSGDPVAAPPEGAILPETYKIARGAGREALIKSMRMARDRTVDELWAGRAANLPISSKEQAVILASIVEKETAIAEERPRVAAVFVNRLRRGMRLESDPTIIYGVSQGRPLGRGITRSELDRATPYNTYKIDGLPPTPIANPGRESIAAVLNPPTTNEIFFVADGTGGHAFAATLAEHQRNVARWREIERSRR
jgi:UPF0755 protein